MLPFNLALQSYKISFCLYKGYEISTLCGGSKVPVAQTIQCGAVSFRHGLFSLRSLGFLTTFSAQPSLICLKKCSPKFKHID